MSEIALRIIIEASNKKKGFLNFIRTEIYQLTSINNWNNKECSKVCSEKTHSICLWKVIGR